MTQQLPHSDQLDISALSALFEDTTNSYKYLFFISLMNLMKDRNFEVDDGVLLRDIEIEMLVAAWYPHVFFRLSFGAQDKITSALQSIVPDDRESISETGRDELRVLLAHKSLDYNLMRYVPYRILRPFFAAETKGMRDHKVDGAVVDLAAKQFHVRRPLFRFDSPPKRILLHSAWIAYLKHHQTILEGWALWHWAEYMQHCNPGIPALTRKLLPPDERAPLDKQKKFWKTVIDETDIRCIYSGKKLGRGYALDHFLPWKFVTHDQLWNLIPADPKANSSKSDQIPSECYIDRLAETQSAALSIARDSWSIGKWTKEVEPYTSDLHITFEETLDREKLRCAYRKTLEPLMSIAVYQGFQSGWTYKCNSSIV